MPPSLGPHFLSATTIDKQLCFDKRKLFPLLDELFEKAKKQWPGLEVCEQDFAVYLAERSNPDASESIGQLPSFPSDLYLALACVKGDAKAISYFESDILPGINPVLARLKLSESDADDLRQDLRERLLLARESRKAILHSYSGSGALAHWVRVVAGRQAMQRFRQETPSQSFEEEVFDALCAPELSQQKDLYRADFKKALHHSLSRLSVQEQTILRALVVDGHTVTRIAETYKVHRVTASRWVSQIRQILLTETRTQMSKELQIDASEVASIIRLLQSQMEMSLARALDEEKLPAGTKQ